MSLDTIRSIIKTRDHASDDDVDSYFEMAAEEFAEGIDPEEILSDVFGLEPDYFFDKEFQRVLMEGGI